MFTIPSIPEPWRLNNLFQLEDGTWRANIRAPDYVYEFGNGETPNDAVIAALGATEMAGRPKGSKNKTTTIATAAKPATATATGPEPELESVLSNHLRFASIASRDLGEAYQMHCSIQDHKLITFDGVVAAGVMIVEDFAAAPHTAKLLKALDKIGSEFSAVVENGALQIKHKNTKIAVPCIALADMPAIVPDGAIAGIDNRIRDALKAVAMIAAENKTTVLETSILMTANSFVSTDRNVMLEAWHGINMPQLVLPKAFATALAKANKDLTAFGFSDDTFTVWFADNSFLQTRIYKEGWPAEWAGLMPTTLVKPFSPNKEFWKGYDFVSSFSEDATVYFEGDSLRSHFDPVQGAKFDIKNYDSELIRFDVKRVKMVRPYMHSVGFVGESNTVGFFNENNTIRGVLAQMPSCTEPEPEPEPEPAQPAPFAGSTWGTTASGVPEIQQQVIWGETAFEPDPS